MNRLFFALDISSSEKQTIAHWRDNQLKLPFKAIPANNFHVTLAFLGQVNAQQQQNLVASAAQVSKQLFPLINTKLVFEHLGLFNKPKVFYLGLSHCPNWLEKLAKGLSGTAIKEGLFQENRPYCPHLSIYRKAVKTTSIHSLNISIEINSFSLYQSQSSEQGVIYQPIKTYPLIK